MKFLRREPKPDPTAWLVKHLPDEDRAALVKGLGAHFGGELEPTIAYQLDRWVNDYDGRRYRLSPSDEEPCVLGRAASVLGLCRFVSTRTAVKRRAVAEYQGDVEAALVASLAEHLRAVGLGQFYVSKKA